MGKRVEALLERNSDSKIQIVEEAKKGVSVFKRNTVYTCFVGCFFFLLCIKNERGDQENTLYRPMVL